VHSTGPELSPETVVAGRYRIRRVLGRGGMGIVYEAEHTSLGRVVALKMLIGEAATDGQAVIRFFQEARAAAAIGHPGIIEIFDLSQPGEAPFLAMEKLDGEELGSFVRRHHALDPQTVIGIGIELCDAVGAAHRNGIVHRDLKPDNVFIAHRGDRQQVKVLDFGIAKLAQPGGADLHLTQTGQVIGTPLYMSPEQMRGSPVDARTDVYSIGAILFESLAGRPPFLATSMTEIVFKVTTEAPPPLRSLRGDIAPALEALIASCLEKDAARRPHDACALAVALRALRTAPSTHQVAMLASTTPLATPPPYGTPVPYATEPLSPAQYAPRSSGSWALWIGCGVAALLGMVMLVGAGAAVFVATRPRTDIPIAHPVQLPPERPDDRPPAVVPEYAQIRHKISGIIQSCTNRYSAPANRSRQRYLRWVDRETGPTGRERSIDGVGGALSGDGRDCADAVAAANAMPPSLPTLERAATSYSQALVALAPTLVEADRYYEQQTYRDDGMAHGRELHARLIPQFDAFADADRPLRTELETQEARARTMHIDAIANDPANHTVWLVERYQQQAMEVVQRARELRLDDDRRYVIADRDGFLGAVEELRMRGDAIATHTPSGADYDWVSYQRAVQDMTTASLQAMRCVRDRTQFSDWDARELGTGIGWTVDGSPDKIIRGYNDLIREVPDMPG
jgi:serine/threonine-protein kinase